MNGLPLLKKILDMAPQKNRTKAVERRMICVIPRYEFQSSRFAHSRIQLHPSITVLEFRTDEFGHPVFKNSGLRSATKAESVKRLSGKSFFANLDPTPACPPREALSSVILVGFQFRCVIQDGRKPDNQMPNVTRGRVSRSASPCPANSS